jgi:5'-AMP-activated protein kinase catalytic alpha subunit
LLKTACGSPCYAAPEMIAGKRYIGLNADIWSAGIVLFAMLAGHLPFEEQNTNLLYKKILAGEYKFPNNVSLPARNLIAGIL